MNVSSIPASVCAESAIPYPMVFGAEILNLSANLVQNYSQELSDQYLFDSPPISVRNIDYCNITVTYTHPGQNDTINVETWLPMKNWNGRLQAVGGGGWLAGRFDVSYAAMARALGNGYVATTTDAGIGMSYKPDLWALNSPGNVDLYALQNFASVSLKDQAIVAKELIKEFYGQPAEYSYWSGCSQGGRQGMMLAQRYPEAYDGIAASAPALNWARLIPALAWPQVMMEVLGQFPPKCELDALTAGAIATCDSQDDVTDGIISDPDACSFDPFSMVGKIVNCNNETTTISNAAATIANLTWTGPRKASGDFLFYGVDYQSRLTSFGDPSSIESPGLAMTTCNSNETCVGMPTGLGEAWLKFMVKKDPDWDFSKIASVEEYARLFKASVQEFESIIGTFDTDLSTFRDAGGKMITFHGMADTVIPRQGTNEYYTRATEQTPDIKDFFRYFEVPGLGHCNGGVGGQPTATFQALVDWVEKGVRPDTLPINFKDTNGTQYERILCPYPEKTRLVSADLDTTKAESYKCAL
ncbi:carboxylic ester hydrolase [Parastagonospora nodorum]|nr:carboxylic ester hydrolase [Parastagonospora nodorum]KAH5162189.1 carboxylic ester hydrolase [Parastagonospora nodorum]KAH5469999.1 carboxylic ester hydrolase [Parastagonospora nodorum]KAH5515753.1 carboxylic ester hydrolase [Parastagonospora nodorum]KAH5641241.1 carboxylic ester hydrolase [Parastagonospora nodorum]